MFFFRFSSNHRITDGHEGNGRNREASRPPGGYMCGLASSVKRRVPIDPAAMLRIALEASSSLGAIKRDHRAQRLFGVEFAKVWNIPDIEPDFFPPAVILRQNCVAA